MSYTRVQEHQDGLATADKTATPARVGPNAVIQLAIVLQLRLGEARARNVFARAGFAPMLDDLPDEMVDERIPAALFAALFDELDAETAASIAEDAGHATADYIMANRIPGFARTLLKLLPGPLAAPLLTKAIAQHSWTFAGSGAFSAAPGSPIVVEIADNPLAMPGCAWHRAVFERLYRSLVSSRTAVTHTSCCHDGAPACRFTIDISGGGPSRAPAS